MRGRGVLSINGLLGSFAALWTMGADAAPRLKPGDKCQRKSDKAAGVVRPDACGRWYCVKARGRTFMDSHPHFHSRNACSWKVVSDRCLCVKKNGKPARAKRIAKVSK